MGGNSVPSKGRLAVILNISLFICVYVGIAALAIVTRHPLNVVSAFVSDSIYNTAHSESFYVLHWNQGSQLD